MNELSLETLVPMSTEEIRLQSRGKNRRRKGVLQLWFVDGLGNTHLLVTSEIERWGLDKRWPRYMRTNLGIKTINQLRRAL